MAGAAIVAAAAVGGGYINEQRQAAERQQREAEERLQQQVNAPQTNLEAEAVVARRAQVARSRPAGGGRTSTILTSPLGLLDEPNTSRNTLLGR